MGFVALLLTVACYAAAVYLFWAEDSPLYLITLVSGHLGALSSPLWALLYDVMYRSDLPIIATMLGQPLPRDLFIASAWFYTLLPLLVLYLYQTRWWFPGYVSGISTFVIFLLYHLLIETLGLRTAAWIYTGTSLGLSIPNSLISAIMGALISLALLYTLLLVQRASLSSRLLTMLPATLALSLLVHGLLGAPLWLALLLTEQNLVINIGLLCTLGLLLWGVHIVTLGIRQFSRNLTT
jgi:hypothetical protein